MCLVSAADKLHNVRSIMRDYREHGEEIWERFQGRRDGTLWYYETVADVLIRRYRSQLTRDLQDAVDALLGLVSEEGLAASDAGGTRFFVACSNA